MNNDGLPGLIPRKIVDRIALSVFAVCFTLFLILLLSGRSFPRLSATTTTSTSSLQVVSGPHGLEHQTRTTQTVTTKAVPPVWQSFLGSRQTIFLIGAGAVLGAYLLAAIAQRVLLGRYAISVGPFSVPDLITQHEVADAVTSALASAEGTTKPEPAGETTPKPYSEPVWAYVEDPNLALAGWRIDLEKEIRRIAEEFHIPERDQRYLRRTVSMLDERGIIPDDMANSLQDLLTIANQGVHGAKVDAGVIDVLRSQGLQLLRFLKEIRG